MKAEINLYPTPYRHVKTIILTANLYDSVWINRQTDCKYKVLSKFGTIETVSNLTLGQAYKLYKALAENL